MSQENVEVVRRAYEHLNRTGTLDEECYAADVEYTTQPDSPLRTTYHGFEGLLRSLQSLHEVWSDITAEERELIETDTAIVALIHFKLRAHSGIELEVDQAWVHLLEDGKIHRLEQYAEKRQALEAVGLSE